MNKLACVALLIAVSIQAQTTPPAEKTSPPTQEVAAQDGAQAQTPTPVIEYDNPEARKRLQELGYFDSVQPNAAPTPAPCAIPLRRIPVPNNPSATRIIPANPSIDPKIVVPPPLPACPSNATASPEAAPPGKSSRSRIDASADSRRRR